MDIEAVAGRYELKRRLGSGGMGDVWLADDQVMGRPVAIKFIGERELRESPGAEAILRDEAKVAGRLLGVPQVVSVLDLIDVDTTINKGPAIVMEFVDGCTLADWISTKALSLSEVTRLYTGLYIGLEVVEAVHAAHKLGILHRDIKPQNVLCGIDGLVKVADFGLARVVEEITRTHTVWNRNTPLYAAPEQWEDQRPTEQTDVYQLCATLYHLLAGRPANEGKNMMGLMKWQQSGTVQPLVALVSGLDSKVAAAIMKGLALKPTDRGDIWKIFDAISSSLMANFTFSVDTSGRDVATAEKISKLTDFEFPSDGKEHLPYPFSNPLEALKEAVGVRLLGGLPVLALA
jgi:serine/threonine protein kinase